MGLGSAVGQIGGAIINTIGNAAANKKNIEAQKQQLALNHYYNELSASNAYNREEKWYNQYMSPEAMLRQYKEAGLSPGLMYDSGGAMGSTTNAPQGGGGNGLSAPQLSINPMEGANYAAAIEKTMAEIKNIKADTAVKENDLFNDPIIKDYMGIKQEALDNADDKENEYWNSACNNLQQQLTAAGVLSEGSTISWSHGEGKSGSESSGKSVSFSDASGKSSSYNVSTSTGESKGNSVGVSAGPMSSGVNGSKSESHSQSNSDGKSSSTSKSHSESNSEEAAHAWAKNVLDSESKSFNKSYNKREAEDILVKFYMQTQQTHERCEQMRERAEKSYKERVDRYMENKSKWHKK